MENKARYGIVGAFLIIFATALAMFLLWQARYNSKSEDLAEYRVYTKESIFGLNENSFVLYKGLNIGFVDKLRIDPENHEQIEIILKISNPNVIKTDSYAVIQSQGISGNKNIEINGGSKESDFLKSSSGNFAVIPLKLSFLDQISNDAQGITQKVDSALYKANNLLNEKNLKNIESILENLNKASNNFNDLVKNINSTVDKSLASNLQNIENITVKLDSLLQNNIPKTMEGIDSFTSSWGELSKDLKVFVNNDLKKLVNNIDSSVEGANNIDDVLMNIQGTMQNINNTLNELNENGGNMIFNTRDIKYGPGENR